MGISRSKLQPKGGFATILRTDQWFKLESKLSRLSCKKVSHQCLLLEVRLAQQTFGPDDYSRSLSSIRVV